jgi:hypothetical protein
MSNDASVNFYITVIGVLLVCLLGGVSFFLLQLGQKIDAQSEIVNSQSQKIIRLEKNFAIVVSVLNTKMPNTNLSTLVTLSAKKDIAPEKVASVVPMIEQNPVQARVYLKDEMYFDAKEVNAVMDTIPSLHKTPSVSKNPLENKMPIN